MNNYNFHYFSFRPNSHFFHRNSQPKNININNRFDYGYNLSSIKYNNNNTSNFRDYSNENNRYNFRAGSITERYHFDNNNNDRGVFYNNNNYYEKGLNNSYNYSMKKNYYNSNNNVNISSENYNNNNFRINNNIVSNYYTNNNNNSYNINYSFNNYNKISNIKRFYTNNNNNNNLNELNYNNNNNNNNLNNNNNNLNNNNNNINNRYINSYINKNNNINNNTNNNNNNNKNILTSILQNFPSNNTNNNTNLTLHDKYLSPYSTSTNTITLTKKPKLPLSHSTHSLQKPSISFLPPQNSPKKTLILDLDETLVHSSFKQFPGDIQLKIPFFNKKILTINVLKRPFLDEFLSTFSKIFEIVIFTSSVSEYANPLLNELDPNKKIFKFRLFREHCVFMCGLYIKDLKKIGRNLKNCVIIDNNPISFVANKENGIPIKSFHYDKNDFELKRIKKLLFLNCF